MSGRNGLRLSMCSPSGGLDGGLIVGLRHSLRYVQDEGMLRKHLTSLVFLEK